MRARERERKRSGPTEPANSVGTAWLGLGHLESSRGSGGVRLSHQADDRGLRALHAARHCWPIAASFTHRPDNNKCLLFPYYTQLDLN